MLCCWFEDPDSQAFKLHLPRLYDYLWVAEDGMKMQGYNGSQLWDTAFAVQAIAATGMAGFAARPLRRAGAYVDASQVVEEAQQPLAEYYRHISKGAWPFSSRDHGWPISDCRWVWGFLGRRALRFHSPPKTGAGACLALPSSPPRTTKPPTDSPPPAPKQRHRRRPSARRASRRRWCWRSWAAQWARPWSPRRGCTTASTCCCPTKTPRADGPRMRTSAPLPRWS